MTLVSEIIQDAFRQSNLIPINGSVTAEQQTEAFRYLNRIIKSVFGNEVGENLTSQPFGGTNVGVDLVTYPQPQQWILAPNKRLVCNLSSNQTIYLNPVPYPGERFGIIDASRNFDTYGLTVYGNGKLIDGVESITLTTEAFDAEYMYRDDLGQWIKYTPLTSAGQLFPFPEEFDEFFITMLAMRLNPAYGKAMDAQSAEVFRRAKTQLRARYHNKVQTRSETGLINLPWTAADRYPYGASPYTADEIGAGNYVSYGGSYGGDSFAAAIASLRADLNALSAGIDTTLRSDLRSSTGLSLIGVTDGGTLASVPHPLNYGAKYIIRSTAYAYQLVDLLKDQIVGYAGPEVAAVNGGYGKSKFYCNSGNLDITQQYSFGWCYEQVKNAGGGNIIFDPVGKIDIQLLTDFVVATSNITFYAPGGNVTFWCDRLNGCINIAGGSNIIMYGIQIRPMTGAFYGPDYSAPDKATTLIKVRADMGSGYAFMNCEARHPSWHCIDITHALGPASVAAALPTCYFTIQNCIFWSATQCHLIGTNNSQYLANGWTYTDEATTRQVLGTFHENIYAYNQQRQPKILGAAFCDIVDNYYIIAPYEGERFSQAGTLLDDSWGVATQEGGWATVRGCLFQSCDPVVDNRLVVYDWTVNPSGDNSYSHNPGRLKVQDLALENGFTIYTRNSNLIPNVPYTLAHSTIPASGPAREAWVNGLWYRAGARPNPAPEGLFVSVPAGTLHPNGETVVLDNRTDRSTYYLRTDYPVEYEDLRPEGMSGTLPNLTITPVTANITGTNYQTNKWTRPAGSLVVAGQLKTQITTNASGTTTFRFNLPITTAFTTGLQLIGTAVCVTSGTSVQADVVSVASTSSAQVTYTAPSAGTLTFVVTYFYEVL